MRIKYLALLLAALPSIGCAETWLAKYGVAKVVPFKLYNTDGTLDVDESDGGTEVSLSCDQGNETTATNDFVDEGTHYSISLTAAEMQCQTIVVVVAATTTEVFFIETYGHASAFNTGLAANTGASDFQSGAIDATAIAADAIGASEVATDAIGAAELAADAIGASEVATDAIGAAEVAADAIGASEIAANALTTAEIATGAISSDEVADGAIDAGALAADAITAAKVASDAIGATEIADGAFDNATFLCSGGSFLILGVTDCGTAQSATATTLVLRSAAAFADDVPNGNTLLVNGSTQGYAQSRTVTDYASSTDTASVDTWPVTPSGTITYYKFGTSPSSGAGSVSISAGGITASSFASGAIDATAIAADAIGASEIAADAIGASELATDAIAAAELAAGATTEIQSGLATASALSTVSGYVDTEVAAILDDTGTSGVVIAAGEVDAAAIATDGAAEIAAAALAAQNIITGTCDTGSTTTCIDADLTQAAATQLEDRLICFDDGWCALITTFTPGSDLVITTKVAPSTRASKTFTIFPSTLE